jgi:predicted nucleic acid-binding protein
LILVDTSVWIDHLNKGIPQLAEALDNQEVLTHPFVIGELACGQIKMRREILGLLSNLPGSVVATDEEALSLIERHRLMGKGMGYADVHLLASAMLTDGARVWTRDKRLAAIAIMLGVGF